jgi:hypothetical protein
MSLTDRGLTLTFESSPLANAFVISNSVSFVTLHNNTLIELFDSGDSLSISFSQPLTGLVLDFALSVTFSSDLDVEVFSGGLGGTNVGSGSATGSIPPGFLYDEGQLALGSAGTFDAIILTSHGGFSFAIDNLLLITAGTTPTTHFITFDAPEPLTLALFGAGLAGVGAMRRRRKLAA